MRATCEGAGRQTLGLASSEPVSAAGTSTDAAEALPASASVAVRPCKAEWPFGQGPCDRAVGAFQNLPAHPIKAARTAPAICGESALDRQRAAPRSRQDWREIMVGHCRRQGSTLQKRQCRQATATPAVGG